MHGVPVQQAARGLAIQRVGNRLDPGPRGIVRTTPMPVCMGVLPRADRWIRFCDARGARNGFSVRQAARSIAPAEEGMNLLQQLGRPFFGNVVAAIEPTAAHVLGHLAPQGQHIEAAPYHALGAP